MRTMNYIPGLCSSYLLSPNYKAEMSTDTYIKRNKERYFHNLMGENAQENVLLPLPCIATRLQRMKWSRSIERKEKKGKGNLEVKKEGSQKPYLFP